MKISRYLDDAILKPDMTQEEAKELIRQGIEYKVRTMCVRPCDIELALEMCKGTETDVITVLDFPHGCATSAAKAALAGIYADMGVMEIDMVMNYGFARSGLWDKVESDIRGVVAEAHKRNVPVKVIFETSELTVEMIERGTKAAVAAGADFVKTSTGFSKAGATVEAVEAMLRAGEGKIKVKPSGGIRNFETAQKYVDMGAARLGVGSGSIAAICDGHGESDSNY